MVEDISRGAGRVRVCRACGRAFDAWVWTVVDGRRGELVASAAEGALQRASCAHCGASNAIDAPFTIVQPPPQALVMFVPAVSTTPDEDVRAAAALVGELPKERPPVVW